MGFSLIAFESPHPAAVSFEISMEQISEMSTLTTDDAQILMALRRDKTVNYHTGRLFYPLLRESDTLVHYARGLVPPEPYPRLFFNLLKENRRSWAALHTTDLAGVRNGVPAAYFSRQHDGFEEAFLLVLFSEDGDVVRIIPSETPISDIECD